LKISIITVCYNSASTIRYTIESVFKQAHNDIEYILVDGNSTDETISIVKEYEPRFNGRMRWISEPDNGLYDAMNKGISMATGDIIGILNSDDIYASSDILSIVNKITAENNVDSCYGNILYIKNGRPFRYWKSGNHKSFKRGWMPPHPSFFVRKDVYEKHGVFRLDCGINADYELLLRFLDICKISTMWINKIFVYMNAGGKSNSSLKVRFDAIGNDRIAWKVNNIHPYFFTLFLKRLRKIPQFFKAKFYQI
jgi:glycosyltransferase involved in cell wall biosynthesis